MPNANEPERPTACTGRRGSVSVRQSSISGSRLGERAKAPGLRCMPQDSILFRRMGPGIVGRFRGLVNLPRLTRAADLFGTSSEFRATVYPMNG